MYERIIVAGFGGQGILFAGQLLAYASMENEGEASWLPSYGPEMRGGTANCMVVISSERIRSPYVTVADSVIAMNKPSMDRFEPQLVPNGKLVTNADMIDRDPQRPDVQWVNVPANTLALELGTDRVANVVSLGAYLALAELIPLETVTASLKHVVAPGREHLLELNASALKRGYDFVKKGVIA